MSIIDVCNIALDIISQGGHIQSMDEHSTEAEACKRHFQLVYDNALNTHNWSFARKDEVITTDDLLADVVALPYKYSYSLPEDVMRILKLTEVDAGASDETLATREAIQFNFRNYDGRKILATDHSAPFAVQYQAYVKDIEQCSPTFVSALAYLLASKLACTFIGGTSGYDVSLKLYQLGMSELATASALDAQQGSYSINEGKFSSFIRARR